MSSNKVVEGVTIADYLFTRLKQLGVDSIHGVPGDYNLALLDYVDPNGIHCVGNTNELNAGYASDGYARIKGLSALITTFGVGELSALNAIAGAFAELVPVVHIVGTPARRLQAERAQVHHTANDGDFRRFALMSAHITVAQADLVDPRTCAQLIDSTIQQCLLHSKPVYLTLPADMVSVKINAEALQTSITLPPTLPAAQEEEALAIVLSRIYASERPLILVDGESRAYGILAGLHNLVTSTAWPTYVTIFGKSCVDETLPNVHGIWKGNAATQQDQDFVRNRDLVLYFGPHHSSTNTYSYSSIPDSAISVQFMQTTLQVNGKTFRDLPAKHFLETLLSRLDLSRLRGPIETQPLNGLAPSAILTPPGNEALTQDRFYKVFNRYLRAGDVILCETGTAGHGCRDFKLPSPSVLFKPATWLSIGYMLPATQGAGLAQRELHAAGRWGSQSGSRSVLIIGDGSFQMTAQELSTIIREKLNVLLVLINNDGYTIERCLHGYAQPYNDIARWRYLQAPAFFGASDQSAKGYHARTYRAETWAELEKVMMDNDGEEPMLKMVEVVMDKEDAPSGLARLLQQQKDAAAVT